MVRSFAHKKIIKKRTKRFTRFECEDYPHKVGASWRKPHGIDCRVRRRFKGNKPMPKVGYGSDKSTRYLTPAGFKIFLVRNAADLEVLLTNNRSYIGELAHNLSARKRLNLVRRAQELNVRLTNGKSKVRVDEKKNE